MAFRLFHLGIGVALVPSLLLASCDNEVAWQVSNRFKAIQQCLDDGGLKRVIDSREAGFTAECKDGRIVTEKPNPP